MSTSTTTLSFVFDLGVDRADSGATVVPADTAMTHTGTGTYAHTFTNPAPGLVYQYVVKVTLGGATHWFERQHATPLPAYVDVAEADALAATTTGLTAWSAAPAPAKAAALARASDEVDRAMPYQGRRYGNNQPREFPRLAFDEPLLGDRDPAAPGAAIVWDWDDAVAGPVVPREVRLAVLLQADSVLDGSREARLDAQHDGVVYDLTGTLAESYKLNTGPGVTTGLCRRAWTLMRRYRLRSGRLL
jgi:hypothetical protein